MARQFLDLEWRVEGIGRNAPSWASPRSQFAFHEADLARREDIEAVCKDIEGPIDVLINNAATFAWDAMTFADFCPDDLVLAFQINTMAPVYLTRLLQDKITSDHRLVVMMSSGNASISLNGTTNIFGYKTSKSALNQATRSIANEWAESDRTIVALAPGWARTAMGGEFAPLSADQAAAQIIEFIVTRKYRGNNGAFIDVNGVPQPL